MTTANEWLERRKTAIHLKRSGLKPVEIAKELKCSVGWVYKWQARFEQESWAGLQSRSRAPKKAKGQLSEKVKRAIVQARSELEAEAASGKGLKFIGPAAVWGRLYEKKVRPVPSTASIGRVLRARGMTKARGRQKKQEVTYPALQPTKAHQWLQVDIVPHYLTGGEAVACFNAIDVFSRYPTGQALAHRRSQEAAEFLIHVWQEIGIPRYTQVDNEGCFSGGFTHKGVLGKVLRLALYVGTELVFSPFYHPQSNGTVERFHQPYNEHVWQQHVFKKWTEVDQHSPAFFAQYRHSRHHSALRGQTPAELHQRWPATPLAPEFVLPKDKLPLTVGRIHFIRQVSPAGSIRLLNLDWIVPKPDPDKGVWATLEFSLTGATLHIYDQAPDATSRTCLIAYPFPLKEPVQPRPADTHSQLQPLEPLPKVTPTSVPRKLIAKIVRYREQTAAFFSTMF